MKGMFNYMVNKSLVVTCPLGIHLRPAGAMCDAALKYTSEVKFKYRDGKVSDAKSVLSILAAGVKCGDEIDIFCNGVDEEMALEEVYHTLVEALKDE